MENEIVGCPICANENSQPFESIHSKGITITYQICMKCGAVYQASPMDEAQLAAFYKQGYRELYQEKETPTKKDLVIQETRAQRMLNLVRNHLPHVKQHLDIGSSSGALLIEIQNAYGSHSVGVEPGDAYRQFSQARGLETYPSVDDVPEALGRFDFVSMIHVLEHLTDPINMLRTIRQERMTSNGYLLLEVPNLIEHEALEYAHPFAFTRGTLQETVRQSGYDLIWTKTHGSFRSPVLNLYITLLARGSKTPEETPTIRSSSLGISIRRKLGKMKRNFFTRYLPDWTWQSPESLWESNE
jgi:hypothetical protein